MITLSPIGTITNARQAIEDDKWGGIISTIELDPLFNEEAFSQIESFSHVEIIFHFHLVEESKIETGARHPRNNKDWPKVGIFAQRGKNRPNRLGATIVKVVKRDGHRLFVQGLDAINGTAVLDIKPVMKEFLSREEITQPEWATELMRNYIVSHNLVNKNFNFPSYFSTKGLLNHETSDIGNISCAWEKNYESSPLCRCEPAA